MKKRLSRQRLCQLRYQRKGMCIMCGKRRDPLSRSYCFKHLLKSRKNSRKLTGSRPRTLGGVSFDDPKYQNQEKQIGEAYKSGKSIKQCAAQYGVSLTRICRILKDLGIESRPQGRPRKKSKKD